MNLVTSSGGTILLSAASTAVLPSVLPYLPEELIKFANLGSMSISFGTHFWVGSIAGLTMFRTLKRRSFGKVQSKLFPKYGTLNTACSLLALVTYLHLNEMAPTDGLSVICEKLEGIMVVVCLLGNIANSLYFIPATTRLMFDIHSREEALNLEDKVGVTSPLKQSESATDDDRKMLKMFGINHGICMLMSLVSMGACGTYLYFIAQNLKF